MFPADPFITMTPMVAYTTQHISELLAQDNAIQFFPSLAADAKHTEQVTMQCMMYLPAKYGTLFLDSRWYTAWLAGERLIPALQQDKNLENYYVLVDWMQVAVMLTNNPNGNGKTCLGFQQWHYLSRQLQHSMKTLFIIMSNIYGEISQAKVIETKLVLMGQSSYWLKQSRPTLETHMRPDWHVKKRNNMTNCHCNDGQHSSEFSWTTVMEQAKANNNKSW